MSNLGPWKDRWVCIGGGTSGFGLSLAKEFALRGAKVAILGRNRQQGDEAVNQLQKLSRTEICFFSVDLADTSSVANSEWNTWVNSKNLALAIAAAGLSDRGYLASITDDELNQLWRSNVLTALHFSQICLPRLKEESGTLVHIGSLAGLLAKPGLGGYAVVKHALTAMSRQFRFEWAKHGIHVLLVSPGPIQRDDQDQRYDKLVQAKQLPDELRKPGGGANLKPIEPVWLCRRIIQAIERREQELVVPSKARWLAGLGNLFPSWFDRFLRS
jgi:uncharacterized protein